jgi:solute carrier family 25 (mitochondrial adenine nucleotide translocator), member 4/5/6/31
VHAKDGVVGIYKGFGISLSGIFMYRGLYFGLYDSTKAMLLPENKKESLLYKYMAA